MSGGAERPGWLPAREEFRQLQDIFPWRFLASSAVKSRLGFARYAELAAEAGARGYSFRRGRALEGFLLAEESEWDSRHFGKRCFRLHGVVAQGNDERIKAQLVRRFLKQAPQAEWVYCRCDVEDLSLLHALLSHRFRLVTAEITFRWDARSVPQLRRVARLPAGVIIRRARSGDERGLRSFAPYFSTNRFVRDSAVDKQRALEVYQRWIVNAVRGRYGEGDEVLVAECEGRIAGFATTCVAGRWSRAYGLRIGTPGLVAVKRRFQGRGLNPALMAKSLLSLLKRTDAAFAPSHITNLRMIRSELKTAAVPVGAEYILHLHG